LPPLRSFSTCVFCFVKYPYIFKKKCARVIIIYEPSFYAIYCAIVHAVYTVPVRSALMKRQLNTFVFLMFLWHKQAHTFRRPVIEKLRLLFSYNLHFTLRTGIRNRLNIWKSRSFYTVKNCCTFDACISICPILNCSLWSHRTSTPLLEVAWSSWAPVSAGFRSMMA
jgi:hypothetical protein